MKIETELNRVVISPDGKEGDSLLLLRSGRVIRLLEKNGVIRQEEAGRATGFTFGDKPKARRGE